MLVNPGAISTAVETRDLEEAVRELNLEGAARGLNFQLLIVTARTDGDPDDRVICGGSWDDRARRVRCSSRNAKDHDQRENEIGLRVALTL